MEIVGCRINEQRVDAEQVVVGRGGHPHVHVVGCPVIRVRDIVADDVVAAVGGRAADENAASAAVQAVAGDGVVVDQGSGIAVARDDADRVAVDDVVITEVVGAVEEADAGVTRLRRAVVLLGIVVDQVIADDVVRVVGGAAGVAVIEMDAVAGVVVDLVAVDDAEARLRIDAVPGKAVAGVVAIVMDQAAQELVVVDLLGGVGVSSDQDAVLGGVANLAALEPDVVGVEGHLGLVGHLDSVYAGDAEPRAVHHEVFQNHIALEIEVDNGIAGG